MHGKWNTSSATEICGQSSGGRAMSMPKYSVKVIETSGGVHAHIVFVGKRGIAERFRASGFHVTHVYDAPGLVGYLSKERTSQAQFGRTLRGGRIKGSHPLEGGGDRVRLSEQLRFDAIGAGYVDPWQQTNAKRSDTRKGISQAGTDTANAAAVWSVARLQAFGGGWMPAAVAEEAEFRRRLGKRKRRP